MDDLAALLAKYDVSTVFTREHDVLLLAAPFALTADSAPLLDAHRIRLEEAFLRGFLRSARVVSAGGLPCVLRGSCTAALNYRLMEHATQEERDALAPAGVGLLVTCPPNAHLALVNFLERGALFTVEEIGRVKRRSPPPPLH